MHSSGPKKSISTCAHVGKESISACARIKRTHQCTCTSRGEDLAVGTKCCILQKKCIMQKPRVHRQEQHFLWGSCLQSVFVIAPCCPCFCDCALSACFLHCDCSFLEIPLNPGHEFPTLQSTPGHNKESYLGCSHFHSPPSVCLSSRNEPLQQSWSSISHCNQYARSHWNHLSIHHFANEAHCDACIIAWPR